jgi:hypothetical protein
VSVARELLRQTQVLARQRQREARFEFAAQPRRTRRKQCVRGLAPAVVNDKRMAGLQQLTGDRRADITDPDEPDFHNRGSRLHGKLSSRAHGSAPCAARGQAPRSDLVEIAAAPRGASQ